ncbi:glutathione S-transferase family protein [Bradymonadaceae bacterium TMQ3]|nr:glutathione S-transferase family protein [Bradymonadaceae bacterium TMQ3]TXC69377.1 glutathione S-transferase family protein [Bradymonadales bacterium TMQ1]
MPYTLITIPFSHYCEKARWSLDHHGLGFEERAYLPLLHLAGAMPAGQRSVPILQAGEKTVGDSTDILHFCDQVGRGTRLFPPTPLDEAQPDAIEAWEEEFDRRLGPAVRLAIYAVLLEHPSYTRDFMVSSGKGWQSPVMHFGFGAVRLAISKSYNITPERNQRARGRIDDLFARVAQTLADGRPYLAGDTFSAADLTFASLAGPLVAPPEYGAPLPPLATAPDDLRRLIDDFRATAAGEFVMRLYRERRAQR